jgi:hypothetical protein
MLEPVLHGDGDERPRGRSYFLMPPFPEPYHNVIYPTVSNAQTSHNASKVPSERFGRNFVEFVYGKRFRTKNNTFKMRLRLFVWGELEG